MKTIVRNTFRRLKRAAFLTKKSFGFNVAPAMDISFVAEKQDWAIKWIGENISKIINKCSGIDMNTTIHPEQLNNQVVHFGSQYMWVDWHSIISKITVVLLVFFTVSPRTVQMLRHIENFLKTIPSLDRIVTGASLVENRLLNWGVPREKLVKIPIGVNTNIFTPCTTKEKLSPGEIRN